jgi:diguanylate cyclase (GGDEF)-like protein
MMDKKSRMWDRSSISTLSENFLDKRMQPYNTPMGFAQRKFREIDSFLSDMRDSETFEERENISSNLIKDIELAFSRLVNSAEKDEFTNLFNKKTFETRVNQLMKSDYDYAFIVVDVNGLKEINDTYGHIAGDKCILAIAEAIKNSAYVYKATACRAGGDEFYLLLPLLHSIRFKTKYIEEFMEYLRDAFGESLKSKGENLKASLAIGYATKKHLKTEDKIVNYNNFLDFADSYMYKNKAEMKKLENKEVRKKRIPKI